MGNYNPRAPIVLGQEWVPIRDEALQYSPVVNTVERGTGFTLPTGSQLRDARFYLNSPPENPAQFNVGQVNLYPWGLQDLTGPIQQVIIPAKAVVVTGSDINLIGASSYTEALYQPGDNKYIRMDYIGGGLQRIGMSFDVSAYPVLANKRILNVSLAYAGSLEDNDPSPNGVRHDFINPTTSSTTVVKQLNLGGSGVTFLGDTFNNNTGALSELATIVNPTSGSSQTNEFIAFMDMGDINNFWNPASAGSTEVLPWRYVDLLRFETSASNQQFIDVQWVIPLTEVADGTNAIGILDYCALRVIYCEERRVAYGGQLFRYGYGMNRVVMRDLSQNADPFIQAGSYLATLAFVSAGQTDFGFGLSNEFPDLNAVRQLYEIPSHPGVDLNVPFPLADRIGEPFTQTPSAILPQLTLHASGGTLTAPHAYGRQAWAQVWGPHTATQEIYDDVSGVSWPYPQVRFYARRFGDTTIPLTLTGTGVFAGLSVTITPASFDALPEILGGAREVTLRFTTAPTMGTATGTPGWVWSAFGEYAGNRWEVLAASAPAISGVPGSFYTQVPSPNQLGVGTYQPPVGSTVELTWMPQGVASQWVTGATIDAATDAVLIFSQDPATVTGHSVSTLVQPVSGIGTLCGGVPCCIPSGISYNQITWPLAAGASVVRDSFQRTVATGIGNPDTGTGPYVLTDVGSAYSVNGSEALITPTVAGTTAYATLNVGSPDFDMTAKMGISNTIPAGNSARAILAGRYTDANNHYDAQIRQFAVGSGSTTQILITKTVAGVETVLATYNSPLNIDAGGRAWVRFMGYGGGGVGAWLKMKIWAGDIEAEPSFWDIEVNDTSLTTGNRAGFAARIIAGTTVAFDEFLVTPPRYYFGGYELQRWDAVTGGDFQTIMLATDITTTSFNDFEARVGQASVYRIRAINSLNFAGLWSTYVTGTPAAPGVTGGCSDMTGALIFTANGDQTGANNAAYAMTWPNTPTESFDLPESDMVTFQPMYGRDGSVAFHGTERGLEHFVRSVFLQGGAIALPSLADAADIRDLAWDSLPYVCVRDGRGNRWLSSVRVQSITAQNDAQNYNGRVDITEVTQTPYPVDP